MSFATLSNTLDDFSAISTLELTKNPFDSDVDGRLALPALSASPSIFLQQVTPGSQKKKGFRWSIDQISKLDPADIEEFPHQDYSSTCERPEDEEKVQEAINQYFSHGTILPSPWTPDNHVKHVTFSPHPPSTNYISGDEDSMTDASHVSPPGNTSGRRHLVDECCQTSLTFPPSFDLSKIVDSGFYSYVEEEGNSATKDLNVSSLRRKLFSPDENNSPTKSRDRQAPRPRVTRSILKSPSPMNLLTSSPMHHRDPRLLQPDSNSPWSTSVSSRTSQSPAVSPIKAHTTIPDKESLSGMSGLKLGGTLSNDDVFNSDVLESSDVCIDPQSIPDVSPIKAFTAHDTNTAGQNGKREKPDDGGPMKMSEISHMSMDFENDEANVSSIEMDIADLQPLTSTQHDVLSRNELKVTSLTHDGIDDDVMTDDVIESSDVICKDALEDGGNHLSQHGNDAMHKNNDDIDSEYNGISAGKSGTHRIKDGSNISGYFGNPMDTKGYCTKELEYEKENRDINQSGHEGVTRDNNGDEALVQRACAAMERADRLVRESCMEQDAVIDKKTGTSTRYLNSHVDKPWFHVDKSRNHVNKGWYHANKAWHPIDMSTPLVSDKPKNKPLGMQNADALTYTPRLDPDSYNNLLSSFANSKLDQRPQAYSAADEDFGLSHEGTSDDRSMNRVRSKGHGTRMHRSLSDLGYSGTHNSIPDAYLSGRYGYNVNGSIGKRFSWPPWQTSRSRYRERCASPTIPCGPRRRSTDDRPRLRRSTSEDLKRYSRPSQYRSQRKTEDYLNVLNPDLRRNFRI